MSKQTIILIADDDSFMRDVFEKTLNDHYLVTSAENGADALMLAQSECPNLIILDVEMPGMDGYELCRRFKNTQATAAVPVIFVSAHGLIEERLKGYEAGAEDYISKPFEPKELQAKVAHLLKTVAERSQLKENTSFATTTAMTAITSLSEMGALLTTLKSFSACTAPQHLADAVLSGLVQYGLQGTVQVRCAVETLTRTNQGAATSLETSVINHMASMGRIIAFKSRMSVTYPHVSLLVNNMPEDDEDRCGRLRDHLCMLVEGAEMKATGLIAENESRQRGIAIEQAVTSITKILVEVDASQRNSQVATTLAVNDFSLAIEKTCVQLSLSNDQEQLMEEAIQHGVEQITRAQLAEVNVQDKLTNITRKLNGFI